MKIKQFLVKLHWILKTQIGIDLFVFFKALRGVIPFVIDYYRFSSKFKGVLRLKPCLHDRYEEGGAAKDEYFWQDLLVSQMIFKKAPLKHVDVGSRIDGFIAHLASFRSVEVFDIRPLTSNIPGVKFVQADLMSEYSELFGYCDSISCLHAIEHFGLGRYGDSIDVDGYKKGLTSMAKFLQKDGYFYLSTPIGIGRVDFNANRVFDPVDIIHEATVNSLLLHEFYVFDVEKGARKEIISDEVFFNLGKVEYSLGIFVFKKIC